MSRPIFGDEEQILKSKGWPNPFTGKKCWVCSICDKRHRTYKQYQLCYYGHGKPTTGKDNEIRF